MFIKVDVNYFLYFLTIPEVFTHVFSDKKKLNLNDISVRKKRRILCVNQWPWQIFKYKIIGIKGQNVQEEMWRIIFEIFQTDKVKIYFQSDNYFYIWTGQHFRLELPEIFFSLHGILILHTVNIREGYGKRWALTRSK